MFGYGLFIALMLVMKLTPQSPLGRWLNAALVERPLAKVAATDRRQVIMLVILVGLTLFATDLLIMFGSYDLLTLYAWDLATYLDVMVVAYALAAVARARAGVKWLALRAWATVRRGTRSRARRVRAARPETRSVNDDEPGPAWSLAA